MLDPEGMNRRSLALGAALLLLASLAGVGLYVGLRSGGAAKSASAMAGRDPKNSDPERSNRPDGPSLAPSRAAPATPVTSDTPQSRQGSAREYTVGNVRIRDHRSGNHARVDVPPAVHAPGGRKIASQLTSDLAQKLRGVMAGCAASVPAEARGATPRVEGEILIAIKDKYATVTNATFQPRDIQGNASDAIKQCLQGGAIGLATPSGDERDLEGYAITLSLRVP